MNLFDHFHITPIVYEKTFLFDKFYYSNDTSTNEQIESALKILVPKPCGHELVRIGSAGDGGYLVPDDLQDIEALFSPGVNNFKDFEDFLVNKYKIKSFMCDFTSDVKKLRTPIIDGMQFFEKKWLDVNNENNCINLNDWVLNNASLDSDLMLQMDIEGAEYRNILYAKNSILKRFRIIVIEFHGLRHLKSDSFLNGVFYPVLEKLNSDFICVHAHPNNCCGETVYENWTVPNVMEFTLLRKDRIKKTNDKLFLPHAKDNLNVPSKKPLHLKGPWLENACTIQSKNNAYAQTCTWLEDQLSKKESLLKLKESSLKTIYQTNKKSIEALRKNYKNIAIDKPFYTSSVSNKFRTSDDNSVTSGKSSGTFGFHTDLQSNPWCIIDLKNTEPVLAVIISNRLDSGFDRIGNLNLWTSTDNQSWELVYRHHGAEPFGGLRDVNGAPALLINIYGSTFRYLKVELDGKAYLHLDQIEIFRA